ncbi:MAG TPA: type II toxin-antitoxin system death-on-curing family toxin [Fimbriimonas sp.]|nr:type II toxin-antitoxin system death-on-curing family toxin [Fimbriimonas sp.]
MSSPSSEPQWLWLELVYAIHLRQLERHGGASGVRDPGMLESAMARPLNLYAYGEPDLAELAGAYCFGIVRNHPFVDGNKRTGFMAMYTFLGLNGAEFNADEQDVVEKILLLADSKLEESELAAWIRQHLKP